MLSALCVSRQLTNQQLKWGCFIEDLCFWSYRTHIKAGLPPAKFTGGLPPGTRKLSQVEG